MSWEPIFRFEVGGLNLTSITVLLGPDTKRPGLAFEFRNRGERAQVALDDAQVRELRDALTEYLDGPKPKPEADNQPAPVELPQ